MIIFFEIYPTIIAVKKPIIFGSLMLNRKAPLSKKIAGNIIAGKTAEGT